MSDEYPVSGGTPMRHEPRMTKEERVEAIRSAAVSFANDYGPLSSANSGDESARHAVAHKLWKALRDQGLRIVQGDV